MDKTITVTKTDKSVELVEVKQLPVKKYPDLLAAVDDEPKTVEIFCDKPTGWSDSLTNESIEQLLEEGNALNRDCFSRWLQRRFARYEQMTGEKVQLRSVKPAANG